ERRNMANSMISLLTDLGHHDHYVGLMKAIMWDIHPTANIVDLCHEINPYDIVEAAFKLECSYRYFPSRSVHVVIVDPEVGSDRRPIMAAGDNHFFIAPDNGVLSWVYESDNVQRVYEITASHYFMENVSNTFHGRDIFAPCAARLLRIMDPTAFGDEITDYRKFKIPVAEVVAGKEIKGKIISIDRFGNCITNMFEDDVQKMVEQAGKDNISIAAGSTNIKGLSDYYAQKEVKQPVALIGNAGYLEISLNKGHAARELKLRKNLDIILSA
ncbi:S-adenosyl-l-methionine hydroxide adenosyltransferase family protein, partial [candidate division CSSED10-310 bacterium]